MGGARRPAHIDSPAVGGLSAASPQCIRRPCESARVGGESPRRSGIFAHLRVQVRISYGSRGCRFESCRARTYSCRSAALFRLEQDRHLASRRSCPPNRSWPPRRCPAWLHIVGGSRRPACPASSPGRCAECRAGRQRRGAVSTSTTCCGRTVTSKRKGPLVSSARRRATAVAAGDPDLRRDNSDE